MCVMRRGLSIVGTCLLALACSSRGSGDGAGAAQGLSARLDGRTFVSTSVQGYELVAGTEVRLWFDSAELHAGAGCNGMSAPYRIDGGVLRISGLSTTEMGCDPALHAQDDWFANLLWSSPMIALNEPELTLQAANASITFLDRELASPDLPLVGTHWVLNAVGDGQAVGSGIGYEQATLAFDEAANVSVFTACQTGTGLYSADASRITFVGLSYDGVSCSDPMLDRVSQAVRSVLDGSPVTYSIEERNLTIERGVNALYFGAGA